ncbi:MAG: hypothetical protein RLZZ382_2218 [Bacteroidota bacterium]|jgi:hypothetical protein
MLAKSPNDYDGFYFSRHYDLEGEGIKYDFFKFKDEYANGTKQDGTDIGDMYHILFIESDDDGHPFVKDTFDAIFIDPVKYTENFYGMDVIGCVVRKTDKSQQWFEEHLTTIREKCKLYPMKSQIQSIADN